MPISKALKGFSETKQSAYLEVEKSKIQNRSSRTEAYKIKESVSSSFLGRISLGADLVTSWPLSVFDDQLNAQLPLDLAGMTLLKSVV